MTMALLPHSHFLSQVFFCLKSMFTNILITEEIMHILVINVLNLTLFVKQCHTIL